MILPEFSVLMQTEQNNPHHCYTVGEHTIHVVQQVENQKVLRLAALFHDIAKPVCKTTDETGVDHFTDIRKKVQRWHIAFSEG